MHRATVTSLLALEVSTGGNKDGAIDALCHGKLGALVDPDDLDAIAQTLIQIFQGKYPHPIMYQPEVLRQKVIVSEQ